MPAAAGRYVLRILSGRISDKRPIDGLLFLTRLRPYSECPHLAIENSTHVETSALTSVDRVLMPPTGVMLQGNICPTIQQPVTLFSQQNWQLVRFVCLT